jgi:hypothetical protein
VFIFVCDGMNVVGRGLMFLFAGIFAFFISF